jgi:hypothetical protein
LFSIPFTKTNIFRNLVNHNNKKDPPPNIAQRDNHAHILFNNPNDDVINPINNKRACVWVDSAYKTTEEKPSTTDLDKTIYLVFDL